MKKKSVIILSAVIVAVASVIAVCVYIFTTPVPVVPRGGNMDVSYVSITRPDHSYETITPTIPQSKAILLLLDEYTATRQFGGSHRKSVTFEMQVLVTREGRRECYWFGLGGVHPQDSMRKQSGERTKFVTNVVENIGVGRGMFSYKIQNAEEFVERVIEILDPDGTKNLELWWD